MKKPIWEVYRCVNIHTNQWFQVRIDFFQRKSQRHIIKICVNNSVFKEENLHPAFDSTYQIYRNVEQGYQALRLRYAENIQKYCLVRTKEVLSLNEFHTRYKYNSFSSSIFKLTQKKRKSFHVNGVVANAKIKLAVKKISDRITDDLGNPHHTFVSIETVPWKERESGFYPEPLNDMKAWGSSEELSQYIEPVFTPKKQGYSPNSAGTKSILKKVNSPLSSCKKKISFQLEKPAALPLIEEISSTSSNTPKTPKTPQSSDSTSNYSFWLRACLAPLGRWGIAVMVCGLIGMIMATPGSVVFYTAASILLTGGVAIGLSLFRVHRNEAIQNIRKNMVSESQESKLYYP